MADKTAARMLSSNTVPYVRHLLYVAKCEAVTAAGALTDFTSNSNVRNNALNDDSLVLFIYDNDIVIIIIFIIINDIINVNYMFLARLILLIVLLMLILLLSSLLLLLQFMTLLHLVHKIEGNFFSTRTYLRYNYFISFRFR